MAGDAERWSDRQLDGLRDQLAQAIQRACAGPVVTQRKALAQQAIDDLPASEGGDPQARAAQAHHALVRAIASLRADPQFRSPPEEPAQRLLQILDDLAPHLAPPVTLYLLGHTIPSVSELLAVELVLAEQRVHQGLGALRRELWSREHSEGDDLPRLRAIFAQASLGAEPSPRCPPAPQLYGAAHRALSPAARLPLLDHVTGCPRCAEGWRLALAITPRDRPAEVIPLFPSGPPAALPSPQDPEALPSLPDDPAAPLRKLRPALWVGLAFGAVAALVALTVLPTYLRETPSAPLQATGPPLTHTAPDVYRGGALRLSWSGAPDGTIYDAELRASTGERLAGTTGLTEPEWQLPPEALVDLEPGALVHWQVWGRTPDGLRVRSPEWPLRLGH